MTFTYRETMNGLQEEVMLPIFMEMAILVMNTHFFYKNSSAGFIPLINDPITLVGQMLMRYKHAGALQNRWCWILIK